MNEKDGLTAQFAADRPRLLSVAYRMLSSVSEADDAVQEAWLRINRAETSAIENPSGWLTTVVARVCLDMLRARKARREEPEDAPVVKLIAESDAATSPEHATLLADSVGLALLVVLETLAPAERLAFVLHDLFDLPFDEIATIVGCSPVAARQLASRARRRVQGAPVGADREPDVSRQREVVDAFLAASRDGNLSALLAVLDPEVVLRSDPVAAAASAANRGSGAPKLLPEVRGAAGVADAFFGRAQAAQLALIDGAAGAVWAPGGQVRVAFDFSVRHGKVVAIDVIADPDQLRHLDVVIVEG